jgi:hypothetical protein
MNSKNLFYGNWQNYVGKHKLHEMEQQYRDLISKATTVAENNPDVLPFRDIFGDKLRVAVPLVQKALGKIQIILDFIYSRNEVYDDIKIIAEPKQVKAKVAGRETTKEIADFAVIKKTWATNPETQKQSIKETKTNIPGALRMKIARFNKLIKHHETELNKIKTSSDRYGINYHSSIIEESKKLIETTKKMMDWWQKNQSKIVEDVNLVKYAASLGNTNFLNGDLAQFDSSDDSQIGTDASEYTIIYSRAPIDVLRMSDFADEGIESCHSAGNSYFHCAIAEAQNEGAIAFAVRTEDLEDIDLDDKEIFEDTDTYPKVQGIRPIQRIRIRTLQDEENNTIIGVPERRTYPNQRVNGFASEVFNFVTERQKNLLLKTNEDGTKQLNFTTQFNNLSTLGGSYFDNPIGTSFAEMAEKIMKEESVEPSEKQRELINNLKNYNRPRYAGDDAEYRRYVEDEMDDDDEDEMLREAAEHEYLAGVRALRNTFLIQNCEFDWQNGEGYGDMSLEATYRFRASEDSFTETFLLALKKGESDLSELIKDLLVQQSEVFTYPDADIYDIGVYKVGKIISIEVIYRYEDTDPEAFRRVASDLATFTTNNGQEGLDDELLNLLKSSGYMEQEGVETDSQKLYAFNKIIERESKHIVVNKVNNLYDYILKPKKANNNSINGKSTWLVAKLTDQQKEYLGRTIQGSVMNDLNNSQVIYHKYIKQLIDKEQLGVDRYPAGSPPLQQVGLPFSDEEREKFRETRRESNSIYQKFNNNVEISTTFHYEIHKEGILSYGYDQSDKSSWVYSDIVIRLNPIDVNLTEFFNFIEQLDENPNAIIYAISEIIRDNLRKGADYYRQSLNEPEARGYTTRGEAEKESSETNLTEARKRIIKERLLNWYKKNKGRR